MQAIRCPGSVVATCACPPAAADVPRLYEITRPTVPAWVFNYTAPVETPKPGATSAAARLAWPTTALLASAAAWLAAH